MNKPAKIAESVADVLDEMDEARVTNMRIWDALSKTDPSQTKPFSRAGGFKGTAIKPIWIIKRLTEQFGPCGVGWGIGARPHFEMVHSQTGEVLVYCTVACWHGNPDNELYGVGGDKAVSLRSSGTLFHDDEAFKKAFTDAVNNAFKFVGVAADIHMGMFDDSKYVAEATEEWAQSDTPKTGEHGPRKTHLDGPYDTVPKLERAAKEFARTLRGFSTLAEFDEWAQDTEVKAFVEQCKRDLPGWWFANHPDCPPDFTPLAVEVVQTSRGLKQLEKENA
jgi:hypothetical protein